MEGSSPLHTQFLKRSNRRLICSSDEEEDGVCRPSEVQELQSSLQVSPQVSTPYICSRSSCADGGSSPQVRQDTSEQDALQNLEKNGNIQAPDRRDTDKEIIIECVDDNDSPWHTDSDSASVSSTPDYKRGKTGEHKDHPRHSDTELVAVQEIQESGVSFPLPSWIRRRAVHGPSVLILADSQLQNWAMDKDKICQVHYHENWPISRWTQAIREGTILMVILYFEQTRNWMDVPPIKNVLQNLCKAVRNHGPGPRVFISNHLPRLTSSPVRTSITQSNFTLQQVTRSVGRSLSKVFELDVYQHFVSTKHGRILKPASHYFTVNGLTYLECLVFRDCVLREAGVKGYWFSHRE